MTTRSQIIWFLNRAEDAILFVPVYHPADDVWNALYTDMTIMHRRVKEAEELSEGDVEDIADLVSRCIRYIGSAG